MSRGLCPGGFCLGVFVLEPGTVQLENPPKEPKALKARLIEFEGYWQVKLQTLEPYGLDSINEFQEQMKEIRTLPMNDP